MVYNVYAVYDRIVGKQYQFAAIETILAKDAVMAFLIENKEALEFSDDELFKSFLTEISGATSIEGLTEILVGSDLVLSMIQVK